jgi:hypothetical protein
MGSVSISSAAGSPPAIPALRTIHSRETRRVDHLQQRIRLDGADDRPRLESPRPKRRRFGRGRPQQPH